MVKYIKLFLLWIGFITITTLFGEHVVSREVNGYCQLLSFVGLIIVLIGVIYETSNIFKKEKK